MSSVNCMPARFIATFATTFVLWLALRVVCSENNCLFSRYLFRVESKELWLWVLQQRGLV